MTIIYTSYSANILVRLLQCLLFISIEVCMVGFHNIVQGEGGLCFISYNILAHRIYFLGIVPGQEPVLCFTSYFACWFASLGFVMLTFYITSQDSSYLVISRAMILHTVYTIRIQGSKFYTKDCQLFA